MFWAILKGYLCGKRDPSPKILRIRILGPNIEPAGSDRRTPFYFLLVFFGFTVFSPSGFLSFLKELSHKRECKESPCAPVGFAHFVRYGVRQISYSEIF
jgi:hypothetical protein